MDLPTGGSTALAAAAVWLDPDGDGAASTEQRPGAVRVDPARQTVRCSPKQLEPVQILAAHQWVAVPELLGLEMLAAFVMPHDPAVADLLADAGADPAAAHRATR